MRPWFVLLLVTCLAAGCDQHTEAPPVPPPPENLSTWTVPELVQPPAVPPKPVAPVEEKPGAAEKVYDFVPGTTYTAQVPLGGPLDIVLERGEAVRNIVGGDRAPTETGQAPRWEVKEGAEGSGDTARAHIFLTTTAPGLTMGVVVTTTKRTYYLTCQSVKQAPTRVLRWRYGPAPVEPPTTAERPGFLPSPAQPAHYHVGYTVVHQGSRAPDWMPRHVVDDGKKLYILYPEVALFGTVPLVRLLGPNGPQLVNARQYLNVVIVDHLVARAELRVGLGEQAETVTITRGALRTIACPGDEACPVWPQAAAQLAGRDRP
jgi:type IV secretory pathway VirB9-like protein